MPSLDSARNELLTRCRDRREESVLKVDYYRIRRRLAFSLPIKDLPRPDLPVRGIERYPWSIWLSWELEERISALGWAAELFGDAQAAEQAGADLAALAQWSSYREYSMPSLCVAHCARLLTTALQQWEWLEDSVRTVAGDALDRIVADTLPWFEHHFGNFSERRELLHSDPRARNRFHNISIIEGIGLALASETRQLPVAPSVHTTLTDVLTTLLDLRESGYTEGVAYDGYVMDFASEWLAMLPDRRPAILDHRRFFDLLDESLALAAPGDIGNVAEIGDVEPGKMPFHLSAHVKLATMTSNPRLAWLVAQAPARLLTSTALASLLSSKTPNTAAPTPDAGALDAHYAVALRTGWDHSDVAAAMAASNSPMGHIHFDNGSVVIGTGGQWVLTDPGYQQYMKTTEREFTVGLRAHNAPLINDRSQTEKAAIRPKLSGKQGEILSACIDLAKCYPEELNLTAFTRTLWLTPGRTVIIADKLANDRAFNLSYAWHPAAGAFTEVVNSCIGIYMSGCPPLWAQMPGHHLGGSNLERLPGSRGHLSILKEIADVRLPVWWVFNFGDKPATVSQNRDGSMTIESDTFRAHPLDGTEVSPGE